MNLLIFFWTLISMTSPLRYAVMAALLISLLISPLMSPIALAWWNCSWNSRLPITIVNNTNAAITNPQIEINLGPPDGGFVDNYPWSRLDVDTRIVDSDDTTLLTFWAEPRPSTSNWTKLWALLPNGTTLAANGGSRVIYVYYNGPSTSTTVSSIDGVKTTGSTLYHSRYSPSNPESLTDWRNLWAQANNTSSGYGCALRPSLAGLSNQSIISGGSAVDILFRMETFFYVATAGTWGFRVAGDFGRGGGLYIDGVAIDEKWTSDLWWAYDWGRTASLLQGTRALNVGWHVFRAWGSENCCDGGGGFQFTTDGGTTWRDVNTTNLTTMRNGSCARITGGLGAVEVPTASINVAKSVTVLNDPINNTTRPKSLPGARLRYRTMISPSGASADNGSLFITDIIPTSLKMCGLNGGSSGISLSQGSTSSAITLGTVRYANTVPIDNTDASYNYSPIIDADGCDVNIKYIKVNFNGGLPGCSANTVDPIVYLDYEAIVK